MAVILIAFGSRCWTIAAFGTDLPFWDQWDGEARDVILPWFSHQLSWRNFAHPHNEHRIALTRLIDLGLLAWNGQWDARLEAIVGAILQSALGGLMVFWSARDFSARAVLGFAAAAAICFALPFAYENTLGGFQLQMFLLLLLSVAALRRLVISDPLSWGAGIGWFLAASCLGTMASGLFAAAGALPILLWSAWYQPKMRTRFAALGTALLAIIALGVATRVVVPEHAAVTAHSAADFLRSFVRLTAWPRWRAPWVALIYPLPWLALMAIEVRRKKSPRPHIRWLAALGVWALLQIGALAYGRKPDPFPAPRYLDLLLLWQLINVAAAFTLFASTVTAPRRRWIGAALGLWAAFAVIALVPVAHKDLRPELTGWREDSRSFEENVGGYLNSGQPAYLAGKIPYPREISLRELLDEGAIARILPASVARPTPLVPAPGSSRSGRLPANASRPAARPIYSFYPPQAADRQWASLPIAAGPHDYWRFYVTASASSAHLEIRDAPSGRTLYAAPPQVRTTTGWEAVEVRRPARTSLILASEPAGPGWFAFTPPIEVSWLSHWALEIARAGPGILAFGACVYAASWLRPRGAPP